MEHKLQRKRRRAKPNFNPFVFCLTVRVPAPPINPWAKASAPFRGFLTL